MRAGRSLSFKGRGGQRMFGGEGRSNHSGSGTQLVATLTSGVQGSTLTQQLNFQEAQSEGQIQLSFSPVSQNSSFHNNLQLPYWPLQFTRLG